MVNNLVHDDFENDQGPSVGQDFSGASLSGIRVMAVAFFALFAIGCYAPLKSPGISATVLPGQFRTPIRTGGMPLNYAALTIDRHDDYLIGQDDILEVSIPELNENDVLRTLRVQVMSSGEVHLPLVGAVKVGGKNLLHAQTAIVNAYQQGFFNSPKVSVTLAEKAVVSVVVLGKVSSPGVVLLPRQENDIAHAIAQAGGLAEDAADTIEVHRSPREFPTPVSDEAYSAIETFPKLARPPSPVPQQTISEPARVIKIPLRGELPAGFNHNDIVVETGDVIVVPSRRNEVFYVVGNLNNNNLVRFTAGERERELGGGFILPRDREIDVVTAVAMAGYIDPIYSPTTVTVQRHQPNCAPLLIHVDLIAARYSWEENIYVAPGDIIYLNPDAKWYFRRTFDRLLPDLITLPYRRLIGVNGGF